MKVASWASNDHYEGGTGTRTPPVLHPVNASLYGDDVEQIACAYHFNIARTAGGRVLSLGGNVNGELGDGTHEEKAFPVDIGLYDVVKVGAGGAHAFALDAYGVLRLWGVGPIGDGRELGEGNGTPVPVIVKTDVVDAWTGGPNTFARDVSGRISGWGWNGRGAVGDGTKEDRLYPVRVPVSAKEVACNGVGGQTSHTVFLMPDGRVACCGANNVGQSGGPPSRTPVLSPRIVPGLTDVSRVFAGYSTSGALLSDGTLVVWGKLPDGTASGVPVAIGDGVSDAAFGTGFVLAVVEGGVVGIGANDSGQLGDGTRADKSEAVDVAGLNGVAQVAVGAADDVTHVAALHLGELPAPVSIFAAPVPGGIEVSWDAADTEKPWQVKHRFVTQPKSDWVKDGSFPPETRNVTISELATGRAYEVFVQNNDFGWQIVRANAG